MAAKRRYQIDDRQYDAHAPRTPRPDSVSTDPPPPKCTEAVYISQLGVRLQCALDIGHHPPAHIRFHEGQVYQW